jgi:serpin B
LFFFEVAMVAIGLPDPVQIVIVCGYNGFQSVRELTADAVARFHHRNPSGPPPDMRVVAAANDLGFSLLRRLSDAAPGRNVFFSPYNVAASMTICANASNGATRAAVLKTLRLTPADLAASNTAQESLGEYLSATDPRIQVKTATSLWADSAVDLNPAFTGQMRKDLKADVESADLHSAAGMARLTAWIARNSDAQLASGIPPMAPEEHIAIVNTLSFHGRWKDQFKRSDTRPGPFHLEGGTTKQLPMMSRRGSVRGFDGEYGKSERRYLVASLPYGDGSMGMLIIVPAFDRAARVADILPLITAKQVDTWMSHLRSFDGGIEMPRFRVRCRPEMDPVLRQSGLAPAYDASRADFSSMAKARSGQNIYLGRTVETAFLEVDEEGTRAASMRVMVFNTFGKPRKIVVDRPFICLIRDNRTGMILFAGAIYDPSAL